MQKSQNCSGISTDILEETLSHEFNTCTHAWQDYPLRLPESLETEPQIWCVQRTVHEVKGI